MENTTWTYAIEGMSCGHCVSAITAEVSEIPGVSDIQVSLEEKTLSFTSAQDVTDQAAEAVDEAGYTLVRN